MSDIEAKSSDQILEELFKSLASQPDNKKCNVDHMKELTSDVAKKNGHESKSKGKKGKKKKKKKSVDCDEDDKAKKRKRHDKTRKGNENGSDVKEKKKKEKEREESVSKGRETDKSRRAAKADDLTNKEEPKSKERRSADKDRERHYDRKDRGRPSPQERPTARERDRHEDRSLRDHRRKRSDSRRRRSRSRSRSPVNRHRARRSRSPISYRRRRSRSRSQRRRRSRSVSNHRRSANERPRSPVAPPASVRSRSPHIDKAQLLQAARENLKRMQESGILPSSLTPLIGDVPRTSSKPAGKTVEEFTDYCKNLIRQGSEDGDDSSHKAAAEQCADSTDASTSFTRHPFQIKPRNDAAIVMNIRNAIPIPVRKPEERVAAQAQLKQQFPVSSGQQHQDLEWVPVSPKKEAEATTKSKKIPSTIKEETKPVNVAAVAPIPRHPSAAESTWKIDISEVVSRRLAAIRKLHDNREDDRARTELEQAEVMSKSWANQTPQLQNTNPITGEPLPELIDWSGAPQAWARRDQFTNAAPVLGGVGMKLLQKMGWQPGEGLGRNKEGTLEPLTLDIKTDKKGLVSREEVAPRTNAGATKLTHEFQGKHPVSMLHELCTKKRWDPPEFEQILDTGPDHLKHFVFKVRVNGVDYRPRLASTTKKDAKAQSAVVCLQSLGILP